MKIAQKGGVANVSTFKQLIAKMVWTVPVDFDLAAAYVTKKGMKGLVYFGTPNKGDLNAFPFMQLDKDAGVGDTGGDNKEIMRITNLDDMAQVYLVCWDWESMKTGAPARFADSDLNITLTDDKGNTNEVHLDAGSAGNVVVLAKIDNTSPIGATMTNTSIVGTIKKFTDDSQIFEIINAG